jgi:predicted acyltransferase
MATDVPPPGAAEQIDGPALQDTAAARASKVPPAASRLVSLDAFRGFIMFWIVGGGGLMVGLQALGHNRLIDAVVYQLQHTPWQGLRFYDTIWPAFMLMVGISIPFAFAKRALTQTPRQIAAHAFKRAVVLFLLGSLRESVLLKTPYLLELSSALQPIAIAYLVGAMVAKRSMRLLALLGALILLGYALLLAFVSAPGIPAGTYELNRNLVHSVDIALLGLTHWNQWPYASEGWGTVLSTIPTVSTTLLGLIIGKVLIMPTLSLKRKAGMIGIVGASCFLAGWALSPIIPVIMKLWTTSYGLASAGVACLEFLAFFWIIDVRGYRKWAVTFVVFGSNAIFIYMFASLIPLQEWVSIFTQGLGSLWPRAVPLLTSVLVLGVEGLMLFWMQQRKIFIKA